MLLQVDKLSKSFSGLQALSDVSFTVEKGEIVGLIGPNGSGKSTLFNVITGFLSLDTGRVHFDGQDISGLPSHRIAQKGMGRTFQLVKPFLHLSALDNLKAGCLYGSSSISSSREAEARAAEILAMVGLENKADLLVRDLTIMERKWVEVGRALATQPKLLLLDEFMAGLNHSEVELGIQRVRAIRDTGVTIIIVEHIIKAITNCSDRVIVLNAGKKIAEGSPAEVMAHPEVIAAYLGSSYAQGA